MTRFERPRVEPEAVCGTEPGIGPGLDPGLDPGAASGEGAAR